MCLQPQRINGRLVACNKCEECRQADRMQWRTRLYYESLHCQSKGGFMVYVTFTYRNANVPRLMLENELLSAIYPDGFEPVPESEILAFRHEDIQKLLKSIRSQVDRDCADIPRERRPYCRYFVGSEYGTTGQYRDHANRLRVATHRPHYHGVFFVYDDVKYFVKWQQRIAKKWIHGAVTYTKDPDNPNLPAGLVSDIRPSMYVCKYISKPTDDDYLLRRNFACLYALRDKYSLDTLSHQYPEACDKFRWLRKCLTPRHWQSQGLGRDFAEHLPPDVLKDNVCLMPMYKGKTPVLCRVPLPKYFNRCFNQVILPPNHSNPNPMSKRPIHKSPKYVYHFDGVRRYNKDCDNSVMSTIQDIANLYAVSRTSPVVPLSVQSALRDALPYSFDTLAACIFAFDRQLPLFRELFNLSEIPDSVITSMSEALQWYRQRPRIAASRLRKQREDARKAHAEAVKHAKRKSHLTKRDYKTFNL